MKNNLLGFLFILGALIFSFSVLVPKIKEVRVTTVEQKALAKVLENKKERVAALQQLNSIFAPQQQQDKIKAIMATLPQEPQIPDILVSIEAMIKESNVNFTSITPIVNAAQEEVSVVIAGQAPLGSIEALMNNFVQNNRPISVSATNLTKVENNIGFNISLIFPFAAEKKAANPAAPGGAAADAAATGI